MKHHLDNLIEQRRLEWEMLSWRREMDKYDKVEDKVVYAKAILNNYMKWKVIVDE